MLYGVFWTVSHKVYLLLDVLSLKRQHFFPALIMSLFRHGVKIESHSEEYCVCFYSRNKSKITAIVYHIESVGDRRRENNKYDCLHLEWFAQFFHEKNKTRLKIYEGMKKNEEWEAGLDVCVFVRVCVYTVKDICKESLMDLVDSCLENILLNRISKSVCEFSMKS